MRLLDYFRPIVYVTLKPDLVSMREVHSGRVVTAPPLAAISRGPKRRLLGIGDEAQTAAAQQGAELVNPFKHPRTLIRRPALRRGADRSPAPARRCRRRLTQIEIRALHELAIGAGASKVVVWQGRELTKDQLAHLDFSSGGEVLN